MQGLEKKQRIKTMPEETAQQGQVTTTEQVKAEEKKDEPWKAEIAGLNRTNSQLQTELKTLKEQLESERLGKMTAEQQAAEKIKQAQAEYESISAQSRAIKIENALLSNGLNKDYATLINGKTDEEINASIKLLKDSIDAAATAKAEAERNKLFANGGGKDIKPNQSSNAVKLEFTREELQTKEGRELYAKNRSLGAHIVQ